MEQTVLDRKCFDSVWSRVSSGINPQAENASETIRSFILSAFSRHSQYHRASSALPCFSKSLRALSTREISRISALQTEYFILTGDTLSCPASDKVETSPLLCLRGCFISAQNDAEKASSCAALFPDRLQALFSEQSKELQRDADSVFRLISCIMAK